MKTSQKIKNELIEELKSSGLSQDTYQQILTLLNQFETAMFDDFQNALKSGF